MRLIAVFEHDHRGEWTKQGGWTGTMGYTDSIVYVGNYDLSEEELKIISPYNEIETASWFLESPTQWSDFVRDEISGKRTQLLVQALGGDFVEANSVDGLTPIMESVHQDALRKVKIQLAEEANVEKEWNMLKNEQNKLLGHFLSKIDVLLYIPRLKEEQDKIMHAFQNKQYKLFQRNIENHYFDLNKKIEIRFLFLNELCGHLKWQIATLCSKYVQEKINPEENGVRISDEKHGCGYTWSYRGELIGRVFHDEKSFLITKELYPLDIALLFNDLDYFYELQRKGANLTEYKNLYDELKRNKGVLR